MSLALGALDLIREFRSAFSPSSHCPWGGIALIVTLVFACGCCIGALVSACIFSTGCRRLILLCLQVLVQQVPVQPGNVRERLAEYRSHRG